MALVQRGGSFARFLTERFIVHHIGSVILLELAAALKLPPGSPRGSPLEACRLARQEARGAYLAADLEFSPDERAALSLATISSPELAAALKHTPGTPRGSPLEACRLARQEARGADLASSRRT